MTKCAFGAKSVRLIWLPSLKLSIKKHCTPWHSYTTWNETFASVRPYISKSYKGRHLEDDEAMYKSKLFRVVTRKLPDPGVFGRSESGANRSALSSLTPSSCASRNLTWSIWVLSSFALWVSSSKKKVRSNYFAIWQNQLKNSLINSILPDN